MAFIEESNMSATFFIITCMSAISSENVALIIETSFPVEKLENTLKIFSTILLLLATTGSCLHRVMLPAISCFLVKISFAKFLFCINSTIRQTIKNCRIITPECHLLICLSDKIPIMSAKKN